MKNAIITILRSDPACPVWTDLLDFSQYWFDNYDQRANNILYLLAADREIGFGGWAVANRSVCVVYSGSMANDTEREETVVHEIGHRFYLESSAGGRFAYIDEYTSVRNHADTDYCIMNYSNNWHNAITDFSIPAIIAGSTDIADDSLRDRIDH